MKLCKCWRLNSNVIQTIKVTATASFSKPIDAIVLVILNESQTVLNMEMLDLCIENKNHVQPCAYIYTFQQRWQKYTHGKL